MPPPDDDRPKKGTQALDLRDMNLEDDPPPKRERSSRGGQSDRDDPPRGGRRQVRDDFDDDAPLPQSGGGAPKGAGTQALDVRDMDFDGPPAGGRRPASRRRGGGSPSRGGGSGSPYPEELYDNDPPPRGGGGGGDWRKDVVEPPRGGGGGGGGGGEPKGATAALDIRDMDFDTSKPARGGPGRGRSAAMGGRDAEGEAADDDTALPSMDKTTALQLDERLTAEPMAPAITYQLVLRELGQPERRVPLQGQRIRVGREVDNDIVILDMRSSRYHFELRAKPHGYDLKDLGGGNGTRLNGERVTTAKLSPGDTIAVGESEMVLLASESAPDTLAATAPLSDAEVAGLSATLFIVLGFGGVLVVGFLAALSLFIFWKPTPEKAKAPAVVFEDKTPTADLSAWTEAAVEPVVDMADQRYNDADLLGARRFLQAVREVHPGHVKARGFAERIKMRLTTKDSASLSVSFDPGVARRGETLIIKVRLGHPVRRLKGRFLGDPLVLNPSPTLPGEWLASVEIPKRVKRGEHEVNLEIVDLEDESFEVARGVAIR